LLAFAASCYIHSTSIGAAYSKLPESYSIVLTLPNKVFFSNSVVNITQIFSVFLSVDLSLIADILAIITSYF
jgi:hypothetical protein